VWDTSKDYRILIAQKSKELFVRTVQTGAFRGHWNKKMAIESANNMDADFQSLLYSYLEGEELANSPDVDKLEEQAEYVIKYLGGDEWNHIFLNKAPKEERNKTDENIAKVQFFLNTILGLRKRLSFGPINDPIVGIDILVGEIMSVSKHPNADSLVICNVNLKKRAITVVTNNLDVKEGNHVGVALLPPQTFMEIASEGMFLGVNGVVLKDVKGDLGEMPTGIPMESLNDTRNLIEGFLQKK
jgi:predicted RNA-binding protein with EMAP domain